VTLFITCEYGVAFGHVCLSVLTFECLDIETTFLSIFRYAGAAVFCCRDIALCFMSMKVEQDLNIQNMYLHTDKSPKEIWQRLRQCQFGPVRMFLYCTMAKIFFTLPLTMGVLGPH